MLWNLYVRSYMAKYSMIIPVYFNEPNLPVTHQVLSEEIEKRAGTDEVEMIYVDDGSGDNSFQVLKRISENDRRVKVIRLSRNFGSQMAVFAGLKHATGDCAGCLSADLQEPPELFFEMVEAWREGNDIVIAARKGRKDRWLTRTLSHLFYMVYRRLVSAEMPKYGYDSFLVDRKVIEALFCQKLNNVGLVGQMLQMGFRRQIVFYVRRGREIGKSRFTFEKRFKLAIDNIVNFSYIPIRLISLIGILTSVLSFFYGVFVIISKIFINIPVPGYTTTVVLILFFSGLILLSLGIIGEYIWRVYDVAKNSPEFLVQEKIGFKE